MLADSISIPRLFESTDSLSKIVCSRAYTHFDLKLNSVFLKKTLFVSRQDVCVGKENLEKDVGTETKYE